MARGKGSSTLYPSRQGAAQPGRGFGDRPNNDLPGSDRNLIRFGTEPLHLSYGQGPDKHYPGRYPYSSYGRGYGHGHHGHGHGYYGHGYYGHGYYGYGPGYCHRPYYYPRSCYAYGGFYPWYGWGYGYGFGLGLGYSYSTVYAEPYVVGYGSATYVPTYESYDNTAYVTEPYPAPATTYIAPETVYAPPAEPTTQPVQPTDQQAPDFSEEQRRTVMDGNAAFSAGRYEQARDLYVRAVLTDERDGYAKMLYAWSNFALGDFTTAAASLRRALVTTPELIDYPMDLRTMYSDAGVLPTHTERLVRHISENPPNVDAELLLAYLQYSIGEAQRASDSFKRIAAGDANDVIAGKLHAAATRAARGQTPAPPPAPRPAGG